MLYQIPTLLLFAAAHALNLPCWSIQHVQCEITHWSSYPRMAQKSYLRKLQLFYDYWTATTASIAATLNIFFGITIDSFKEGGHAAQSELCAGRCPLGAKSRRWPFTLSNHRRSDVQQEKSASLIWQESAEEFAKETCRAYSLFLFTQANHLPGASIIL